MRPPLYALPLLALTLQGPSLVAEFSGGRVEARGACDIRPDAVACWNMEGRPSESLTDGVRAALEGNGREVQFKLGRKNRYLIVRRPQNLGVSFRLSPGEGVYGNFSQSGDPQTEYLRVSAAPTDATVTIQAQATVQSGQDVDLSLREGTHATIEAWDVEVGAAQKVVAKKGVPAPDPRRYYGYGTPPPNTDYWNVVIGLKGQDGGPYVQWAFTPLDAGGAPIRFVDAAGRPISAVKALALEPTLQPNNPGYYPGNGEAPPPKKPKAMAAYFQGAGQAPAFRATTNIDPKAIATVRIRASRQETKELGPFPLDPK